MTFTQAYSHLSEKLADIYDAREAAIISRYIIEDVFQTNFWSEDALSAEQKAKFHEVKNRLLQHEPWQYIGGFADFYGYKFKVNPSVLIPRPETEELVFVALDYIKHNVVKSILDIGTGSGIIPVTIGKKIKHPIKIDAIDISQEAIRTASDNAGFHNVNINFIVSDFLDKSKWHLLPKANMILSNPPYIAVTEKDEMAPNVLEYEPHIALFVGNQIMEFYDAIGAFVANYQNDGCFVLVEINEKYGQNVIETFQSHGLKHATIIKDMQNKDRMVSAVKG